MISISPQVLEKNGKKEFVIFSYEDFLKLQEELACYDDLRILLEAKKRNKMLPQLALKKLKAY